MVKNDFCHSGQYIPPSGSIRPEILPHWFGHQRTTKKIYFFNGMKRGNRELVLWQYTISGCGMVEFDGKKYPVAPGEAFLLTIPEKHLYYLPDTPGEWEFLYLSLEGSEAMRIARQLRQSLPPVSRAFASDDAVAIAKELLRRGMEHDFSTPQDASITAYRFMMALTAGSRNDGHYNANDLLLKVHHFCIQHISGDIPVEMLAEFSGYSRSHFCRIFNELAGTSPHEYILQLRIRMATRMLQNGSLSVKETADACGFADTGYFCKVFRKFTGTTPGKFKQRS